MPKRRPIHAPVTLTGHRAKVRGGGRMRRRDPKKAYELTP